MDISQIDPNLKVVCTLDEKDILWFDVRKAPFTVYGLYDYQSQSVFRRLPESVANATSNGVAALHTNTAGGRLRFRTNSPYIAIKAEMPTIYSVPHMTLLGSAGFDIYKNKDGKGTFFRSFKPPIDTKTGFESIVYVNDVELNDYTINFPLYSDVSNLYIGLDKSSVLQKGDEYRYQKPILFYGSSITQGGCASRPGNCYENFISRKLDCNYINLGFSGNGKAEDAIADYIADMDISVFVCDYDHNAPSVEYLQNTHKKLYQKVREKQSELPIVLISRPDFDFDKCTNSQRRNVIYTTFIEAVNSGDKHVYYIDGESLFGGENRDACTVDGCHPNDLGFSRMADSIGTVLAGLL